MKIQAFLDDEPMEGVLLDLETHELSEHGGRIPRSELADVIRLNTYELLIDYLKVSEPEVLTKVTE